MSANSTGRSPSATPPSPVWIPARRAGAAWLLGGVLLMAACDREAAPDASAPADTAAGGLSQEQLQQQAQPMTREQAEQAGIIDTTEAEQPSPVGPNAGGPLAPLDTVAPPAP